jgi:hypothetical protein
MINLYKISSFVILFFIISCSGNSNKTPNQEFLEQYGDGLNNIKRRINDNKANAQKIISDQYNTKTSLDINKFRYGNYNRNSKIYFPNYLEYNFPTSYPVNKVSFNDINIPKIDSFNILTDMKKSYPIINNNDLQRNIRKISGKE